MSSTPIVPSAGISFRFNVVSTFSGCGGSSLGYQLAGGKVLLAVEWDKNAVETYRLNFPLTPIYYGDIAKLSVAECLSLSNLKPRKLDILDGSPPCQGFSTAGKRIMDDPRNQLFREYVRLLQGLQPKVFVMENVSGMVKGKMKLIFVEILRELKKSGYRVKAQLINAMYFNVPQSRQRMIFVGVREDLGIGPTFPKAQTIPTTLGQAIANINVPDKFARVPEKSLYFSSIAKLKQGQNLQDLFGTKGFNWIRCHPNKPCPSIPKSTTYGKLSFLFHPNGQRCLSMREHARCH